jgi:hypothetical protein
MKLADQPFCAVVGAPKCGTTSLHHYLDQHPGVFVPPEKELHYFSQPEVADSYNHQKLISSEADYLAAFEEASAGQIWGDCSPSYLAHPRAAARMKEVFGCIRVIICVRDPVDRAISHYLMDHRRGLVEASLIDVLNAPERFPLHFREYVRMGEYHEDLQRYASIFRAEEMRVVTFRALTRHTTDVVTKMWDFLGLEPLDGISVEARNVFRQARSRKLISFGRRGIGKIAWQVAKTILPRALLQRVLYTEVKPEHKEAESWLRSYFDQDWADSRAWLAARPDITIDVVD